MIEELKEILAAMKKKIGSCYWDEDYAFGEAYLKLNRIITKLEKLVASAQTFDYWKEQLEANKTPMLLTELSPTPVEGENRD